jgi:hypothetical protein
VRPQTIDPEAEVIGRIGGGVERPGDGDGPAAVAFHRANPRGKLADDALQDGDFALLLGGNLFGVHGLGFDFPSREPANVIT